MSSLIGGGATFGALQTIIGADISGALKGFKATEVAGQKTATKMAAIGATMAKGFGLALAGIGIAATKMAVDFEKGMSKIGTLIPGQTERLEELGSAINDVRIRYGKAADDIQEGTFQVISAFGDSVETVGRLDVVARAAAAGFSTTQESLNLLSAVTKGYGDTSIEALSKVADLAFLTNKLGQTTYPEMASAMGRVIPTAKVLNVTQAELFGVMATLSGVTGNTNEVTTQFAGVLRSMIKPTDGMKRALKELGFETGEEAIKVLGLQKTLDGLVGTTDGSTVAIGKLFRRAEAMTALFALTGAQSDKFTKSLKAMNNAGGETAEAFGEVGKTTAFALAQMGQKLAVMTEEIGNQLIPVLNSLMKILGPLAEAFLKISGPILGFLGSAIQATAELFTENLGEIDSSFKDTRKVITSAVDGIIKDLSRLDKKGTESLIVNLKSSLVRAKKDLEKALLSAFEELRPIPLRSLIGFESKAFKGEFEDLLQNQEAVLALRKLLNTADVEAQGNLRFLLESYTSLNTALGEAEKKLEGLGDEQKTVATTTDDATTAVSSFADELDNAAGSTDALQKNLDEFQGILGQAGVSLLGQVDIFEDILPDQADVKPPFRLIGQAASDAFSSAFQQNFNEFSDFGKAFAIGFGAAFSSKLKDIIGKLDISGIFGDLLGAFAPVFGNLLSSGISSLFGKLFGGGEKIDFEAQRIEAMEKLNDSFADFNDTLDDVISGTEEWDQAFVDLFNSFKSNNLLDIDSVFDDIAGAISGIEKEISSTIDAIKEMPNTLRASGVEMDNLRRGLIGLREDRRKAERELLRSDLAGPARRAILQSIKRAQEGTGRITIGEERQILRDIGGLTPEHEILVKNLIKAENAEADRKFAIQQQRKQIELQRETKQATKRLLPVLRDRLSRLIDLQKQFNEHGIPFLGNKLDDIVRAIRDIPSFQAGSGGPVQQNQLAFIHAGETVVPAGQSTGGPMTINFVVNDQILQSVVVPTMQNEIDNGQTRFAQGALVQAGKF